MGIKLADAFVFFKGDSSELDKAQQQSEKSTGGWVSRLGGLIQNGLVNAITKVGSAVIGMGVQFDDALDGIAIKTGATGDALAGLEWDFKMAFANTPASMEDTSAAISELNRRLNLTGEPLQALSGQMLDLSRMLGTDVTQNAQSFSRAVGDWGIPLEDSSKALDMFFKASQETGIGVDTLMQKVVQFGSPLRLMGFTLEESTALFAKWEQEGVNAELVMGSLRIAAVKFAEAGVPLREGLLQTIETIKGTEDSSKALALAIDVFGTRAGPDMAAAIREGRFELGDLMTALDNSDGAIAGAAKQTDGFAETLQRLKNTGMVTLEPLGTAFLDLADKLLVSLLPNIYELGVFMDDKVTPAVTTVIDGISRFIDLVGQGTDPLLSLEMILYELVPPEMRDTVSGVIDAFRAFVNIAQQVIAAVSPYIEIAATWIMQNVELEDVLIAAGIAILQVVIPALGGVIAAAAPVIATAAALIAAVALVRTMWESDFLGIRTTVENALNAIKQFWTDHGAEITAKAQEIWDKIKAVFEIWKGQVEQLFAAFKLAFEGDWRGFGEKLREYWDAAWALIKEIGTKAWESIQKFFTDTDWGAVGKAIIDGIANGISNGAAAIAEAARNAAKAALDAAKGFLGIDSPSKAFEWVGQMTSLGMERGILEMADSPVRAIAQVADGMLGAGKSTMSTVNYYLQPQYLGRDEQPDLAATVRGLQILTQA